MNQTTFLDVSLTVAEASFVTGYSVRSVNHEIDGAVLGPLDGSGSRRIGRADLLYLGAVKNLRAHLDQGFRKRVRSAIHDATRAGSRTARIDYFSILLDAVENELVGNLRALRRLREEQIETRPDILAGEPVLKGTRVPVRHIADLRRQGVTAAEIIDEFDLVADQVEAAELFDRVSPRQGRPPRPRTAERRIAVP